MERVILQQALPEMGNFATLKIVHQLRMALAFSEDEIKAFGVTEINEGRALHFAKPNEAAEIPIGEKATDLIVKTLKGLNKAEKLSLDHLSLWEKFLPGEE